MPETTMNKNDGVVFRKDNVRFPRQMPVEAAIDGETVSHAVKKRTDNEFRFCVLRPDAPHVPASVFGCQCVTHKARLPEKIGHVSEVSRGRNVESQSN